MPNIKPENHSFSPRGGGEDKFSYMLKMVIITLFKRDSGSDSLLLCTVWSQLHRCKVNGTPPQQNDSILHSLCMTEIAQGTRLWRIRPRDFNTFWFSHWGRGQCSTANLKMCCFSLCVLCYHSLVTSFLQLSSSIPLTTGINVTAPAFLLDT